MTNRVMGQKYQKLRAQRRRHPRRMDLDKRGPRPNLAVLADYKEHAKGLAFEDHWLVLDNGEVMLESEVPLVNAHLSARADIDVDGILQKFDQPKFVLIADTPARRVRVYFNSKKNKVFVQEKHHLLKVMRLSECFTCIEDAFFAWEKSIIAWKLEKSFGST